MEDKKKPRSRLGKQKETQEVNLENKNSENKVRVLRD